jgi:hypothetical protein
VDRVQVIFKVPEQLVEDIRKALDVNDFFIIGKLTKHLWREWIDKQARCIVDMRFHCPTPTYGVSNCNPGGGRLHACSYLKARYENPKIVKSKKTEA